jgi:hypothetical protein
VGTYTQLVLFLVLVSIASGVWSLVNTAKSIEALLKAQGRYNSK